MKNVWANPRHAKYPIQVFAEPRLDISAHDDQRYFVQIRYVNRGFDGQRMTFGAKPGLTAPDKITKAYGFAQGQS
jgi:hypothetical protein